MGCCGNLFFFICRYFVLTLIIFYFKEWKGAWSDNSREWKYISDVSKEEIGLTLEDDGEFWMSFEDFKKYFESLDICNIHPDIEMRDSNPSR